MKDEGKNLKKNEANISSKALTKSRPTETEFVPKLWSTKTKHVQLYAIKAKSENKT